MKILFINTIDNVGGAALVGWNLGKELEKRGHQVNYVVGFKKSKAKNVYQLMNNPLFNYLTNKTGIDFNFMSRGAITKLFSNDIDFGASDEILNHPWYKEADVVHRHNLHGNYFRLDTLIKMSAEKKVIWTLHDEWAMMASGAGIMEDSELVDGLYWRTALSSYPAMIWDNQKYLSERKIDIYNKSALSFTVPSIWLKQVATKTVIAKKEVKVIHNGVDGKVFRPYDKMLAREELGLPIDKQLLLFVADNGKKNSWKGWNVFKNAANYFQSRRDLLFICIGGGQQGRRDNSNILYVDYIKDQFNLAKYYSAVDTLLFPSTVESFGLVAVEAMACGTPIVSFPVGVIPELVKHKEDGYIARYGDKGDFVNGIEFILGLSQQDQQAVSRKLIAKVEKDYTLDIMTKKYLEIYGR